MRKLSLLFVTAAVLCAVPSVGLCDDNVYVRARSPMIGLEPGKVYYFNFKPEEVPKDAPFTREGIISIMEETARAIMNRDSEGSVRYFLPGAVIHLISGAPGGDVEIELTREQYMRYIKEAWGQASSYSYRIEDVGVVMGQDGKSAMLKAKISEEAEVEGNKIVGKAVGIADVRKTGHGPMIARMVIRGMAEMPE